jgi:hypothetical protein
VATPLSNGLLDPGGIGLPPLCILYLFQDTRGLRTLSQFNPLSNK